MPRNPNIEFHEPQSMYRTSARVKDEGGNLFDIPLAGPEDLLRSYVESAPLRVKLVPPEALNELEKSTNQVYGKEDASASNVQSQQQDVPPQEDIEKEAPPRYPIRALEIEISVAQTSLDKYALHLEVDPDIPQGDSHYYRIDGAAQAWATCQTSVGDADIYLYEQRSDGSWLLRASSANWGTQSDSVSANQQETGNWRMRVYGYSESTYSLNGTFNAI